MIDIFFSYKSEDRERVRPIHDALVAEGFDVFWDQKVPAGQDWDKFIRGNLTQSKCAIVFWSRQSIGSDNIRHEAAVAKDQGKLVAVLLEPLAAEQFPMGLYTLQAVNLANWKGDFDNTEWKKLCREVEDKLTPLWVRHRTAELEAELEAQRGRLSAVESRDKVLRAQIAREAQAQEELKQQRDKALEEVSALQTATEDLKQQLDSASEKVGALQTATEELKRQRDKALEEISTLQTATADMKQRYDKAIEEVSALKAAVEALGRRCSETDSQAVELSQRLTEAEAQRLTLAQQSETATLRAAKAESNLQDLQRKMEALHPQLVEPGTIQQRLQPGAGRMRRKGVLSKLLIIGGLLLALFSGGGSNDTSSLLLLSGVMAIVVGVAMEIGQRWRPSLEAGAGKEERVSGSVPIENSVQSSTAAPPDEQRPSLH